MSEQKKRGRPPRLGDGAEVIRVRLSARARAQAVRLGNGNRSEGIRRALNLADVMVSDAATQSKEKGIV